MPMSEARKRANAKWDRQNMATIGVRLRKPEAEQFKAICKERAATPNSVLVKLVRAIIADSISDPKESSSIIAALQELDLIEPAPQD